MKYHIHACIAYIVGRLVSGKQIGAMYDYAQSQYVDIKSLTEDENLQEFNCLDGRSLPGPSSIATFQYACSNGHSLELRIKGNTFIGHLRESSSHFIGNVRGDTIYLFDHKESAHLSYRISEVSERAPKTIVNT